VGRALRERELGEELGGHALARLVAGIEVVAERLDHVVEGAGHVGDTVLAQEREERPQEAARRAHLAAVGRACRRRAEVAAEELVGPVDEVELHGRRESTPAPVKAAR
jgi:hypothetical protein